MCAVLFHYTIVVQYPSLSSCSHITANCSGCRGTSRHHIGSKKKCPRSYLPSFPSLPSLRLWILLSVLLGHIIPRYYNTDTRSTRFWVCKSIDETLDKVLLACLIVSRLKHSHLRNYSTSCYPPATLLLGITIKGCCLLSSLASSYGST